VSPGTALAVPSPDTIGDMTAGIQLARNYYEDVVAPLLEGRLRGLPYAAARLGTGSEVLGLDDDMSRDHDWGLRLTVFAEPGAVHHVATLLDEHLPQSYAGLPVRFRTTWDSAVRHRVEIVAVSEFVTSRLGVDATTDLTPGEWLGLTGQSVLEVTSGAVFADTLGALTRVRERLAWYPDDVWRHVVAADWSRLGQELPLMSRAGHRDDDLGSRVLAARLVGTAVHLAFLLARRWPPYPKWLGTAFARLPVAADLGGPLAAVLAAGRWQERAAAVEESLSVLFRAQHDAGLPVPRGRPSAPFFDRPFPGVRDEMSRLLLQNVTDPLVRQLPPGVGAVEQWVDNVDVLTHPGRRMAAVRAVVGRGIPEPTTGPGSAG
jgi:Domain of unknown function (DUF4037)